MFLRHRRPSRSFRSASRLLPAGLLAALAAAAPLAAEQGRIVGLIDADTFQIDIAGARRTVRLIGVDAPDPERPTRAAEFFGLQALRYASELIAGGPVVTLDSDPKAPPAGGEILQRHARLADGRDLATELLRGGCVSATGASTRFEDYRQIERAARREKRGMWDPLAFADYQKYLAKWQTTARDFGPSPDFPDLPRAESTVGGVQVFVFLLVR